MEGNELTVRVLSEVTMEKPKKEISEDDVLAAILKVKPTEDMPRSRRPKAKTKAAEKSGKK